MVEITDAAVERIKEVIKEEKPGASLRIFMAGGCCGGPSLAMDLTEKPEEGDVELKKNGLTVYVSKDAAVKLDKATVDRDTAGGIIIKGMPQAAGGCGDSCGCGDDCGCGH
jgi:iron-sulfur cluster insertion protein